MPPDSLADRLELLGFTLYARGPEWAARGRPWFVACIATLEAAHGRSDLRLATPLSNLAVLDDDMGHPESADTLEARALALREAAPAPDSSAIGESRLRLATFRYWTGEYDRAAAPAAGAVEIARGEGGPGLPLLARACNASGEIARAQDRADAARASFELGLRIADSLALPERALLLNNLAGLERDLARFDVAKPLLERSLTTREALAPDDLDGLATAHLNLAEVDRLQGRVDEAGSHYERAVTLARTAYGPTNANLLPFLNQYAVFARDTQLWARADSLFRLAQALADSALGPANPWHAQVLFDRVGLCEARGDSAAAAGLYMRALEERRSLLGEHHSETATTAVARARVLVPAGQAPGAELRQGLDTAITDLERARFDPEARLEAYALRARFRAAQGDSRGAGADYDRAISLADEVRSGRGGGNANRAHYLARVQELYDSATAWWLDAGNVARAFEVHDHGRGRVLLDQLRATGLDFAASLAPGERDSLHDLESHARMRLARAEQGILGLTSASERPRNGWSEAFQRFAGLRDSAAAQLLSIAAAIEDRSPAWQRLAQGRDEMALSDSVCAWSDAERCAVLEYHVGPRACVLFAILPGDREVRAWPLYVSAERARVLGLPPGALRGDALAQCLLRRVRPRLAPASAVFLDLGRRVAAAPDSVPPLGGRALTALLHALYGVLVPDALWARLAHCPAAVVIPDGELGLLPYEALVTTLRAGRGATPRYWLDDGPALAYAVSASSLLQLSQRPGVTTAAEIRRPALSIVDPAYAANSPRTPWPRLAGTRAEAQAFARALGPENLEVLFARQANEARVRAEIGDRALVHFGVHAFAGEEGRDILAGLVLTPGPEPALHPDNDGILHLDEIYSLRSRAELVILSACETNAGPVIAGEGALALSRGFLAAGARRVLATLWPVRDDAQAALMTGFASRFRPPAAPGAGRTYAETLREAKLRVRRTAGLAEPWLWAGPVLVGPP